ncbi:EAL domain-containing protein [Reinekea forsetii]|nr:EAL domain-containing protein [Reinekea forsetii]
MSQRNATESEVESRGPPQPLNALFNGTDIGSAIVNAEAIVVSSNSTLKRWLGRLTHNSDTSTYPIELTSLKRILRNFNAKKNLSYQLVNFPLQHSGLKYPLMAQGVLIRLKSSAANDLGPIEFGLICWMSETSKQPAIFGIPRSIDKLIYSVPIGIISINGEWECEFVNGEFCLLTEKTEAELAGREWIDVFMHQHERLQSLVRQLSTEGVARVDLTINSPGRRTKTLELELKGQLNADGTLNHAVGALVDVSDRVERQNEIHRLANFDPITGLHNRLSILHQLERYINIAQELTQPIHLLFVDLDSFKMINDLYGHPVGDLLLKEVGERLKECVRDSDLVSRFGGDEFLLIIPGAIDQSVVDGIATKIIERVGLPYQIKKITLHTSVSIGIADYIPNKAIDNAPPVSAKLIMDDLIQRADITLYSAKKQGKNRYVRFTNDDSQKITDFYNILQKLTTGIENKEFNMVYQPIVNCKSGEITTVEALIRWNNKEMGKITPERFIPIAESHGKIADIQYCMIEQVSRDIALFTELGVLASHNFRIAINLSASQIVDIVHLSEFLAYITDKGILPSQISLEITESMIVNDDQHIIDYLASLIDQGFHINLDDFGTGYSSLSYLTKIPLSAIKLDKSFIEPILKKPEQRALVDGVLQLAHSLNLTVVAEGVENDLQRETLSNMGCDCIQGFAVAKPMPPKQLAKWITRYYEH